MLTVERAVEPLVANDDPAVETVSRAASYRLEVDVLRPFVPGMFLSHPLVPPPLRGNAAPRGELGAEGPPWHVKAI